MYVNSSNLYEIENESLDDFTGDFELIGSMLIGEIDQRTKNRFKNVDDFETYIDAIDDSAYDSDDVFFTGWLYNLNTPELNQVNRYHYGRSTDFKQDILEYTANNS